MALANNRRGGTRFRLYPQSPGAGLRARLETVTVSSPAGSLGPGPSDDRMYTIAPVGKRQPYGLIDGPDGEDLYLPPWSGRVTPAPIPGLGGHFDHLLPSDPGFKAAHLFGTVRFTLDVWERYLQAPVAWHFADEFPRLELSMVQDWANAHMGYGYLETGSYRGPDGHVIDYGLNFDLIAHEVGHAILVSLTGPFQPGVVSGDFQAFHEMSSDWVALIASLHFDSVVNELLETTRGNLDTYNRFSRFGELSSSKQLRLANNNRTMHDYARGWRHEHDLAKPLIGAFFDIFVDIYHEFLLQNGGVSRALEDLADRAERDRTLQTDLQRGFDKAFERNPDAFGQALSYARDTTARMLVEIWLMMNQATFTFADIPPFLHEINDRFSYGRFKRLIDNSLDHRGLGKISAGPRTREPDRNLSTTLRHRRFLFTDSFLLLWKWRVG